MSARDEAGLAQQAGGGDMAGAHHGTVDEPVGLEYTIRAVTCFFPYGCGACHAAIWYSYVSPPRTCFRRIRCPARLISGGRVPA
jgi:hypothetical protein